jgi:pSer/pThr/pTyr-binding forkhead associated (FHA) protein
MKRKQVLEWTAADGSTTELELMDGTLVIGRASTCDLVLDSTRISRRHAQIRIEGEAVTIEDLGSSNGTFVNGEHVAEAGLRLGDRIAIADVTLTFRAEGGGQELAATADGTAIIMPTEIMDSAATQVLEPAPPPEPAPSRPGLVSDEIIAKPVISEAELAAAGVPVKVVEYLALGGGIGSFVWVDALRNSGVPAADIAVAGNEAEPYGRYRRLVQNSQIPDHERLRSNSDSCPDNIWGFPGYAAREIWRDITRGRLTSALGVAWMIFGEPTIAATYTPQTSAVWESMDKESARIGWKEMLVQGRIRYLRKTEEGRFVAIVSQSDATQRRHVAVAGKFLQIALGYPALQFLPDLAEFREKFGDRTKVVNAYENHGHVYEKLRADGGTVVLRGRGIVASRIIQRLFEERRNNDKIVVVHLHRSRLRGGHSFGPSRRQVKDEFEFQPFNWPKAAWGGETRALLESANDEERKRLLEVWGGTTTANRPDWIRMVRGGIADGWYRPEYGVVREVSLSPEGKVVTQISSALAGGGDIHLEADFVIDCTGLIPAPERAPVLKDLIETYGVAKNPLGRLAVSNDFEIESLRHADCHVYACGAMTLGGPYAPVDSFLGLQYAGLRAVKHMQQFRPRNLHSLVGLYSFGQWLKWAQGRAP